MSRTNEWVPSQISFNVRYGIENENVGITAYERNAQCHVKKAGLFIFQEHLFLASSPDGLIGENVIIEVKCPYSLKNKDVSCDKLDYLNCGGTLKRTHPYFYQVQELLKITKRESCDFIIFTGRDMKVERVLRDDRFWNTMYRKLKEFYYFWYLPLLIKQSHSVNIQLDFVKWTTLTEINFFRTVLLTISTTTRKQKIIVITKCAFIDVWIDIQILILYQIPNG